MLAIREEFATPRVCEITYDDGEMSIEDLVDDKELVIVMTEAQYVKSVSAGSFKSQGRGGRGVSGGKLKADDIVRHVIFTPANSRVSMIAWMLSPAWSGSRLTIGMPLAVRSRSGMSSARRR